MNNQVFTDNFLKSTEFAGYVSLLSPNTKYYCTYNVDRNIIDSYVNNLVKYHCHQSNIELTNEYTIQYELVNNIAKNLQIEYVKNCKLHPELSILCYWLEHNSPVVFTDVDLELYKYKEFKTENKICIYCPEKGCQVVFDGSKYYGAVNIHNTPSDSFLKINLFKIKRDKLIDYMQTAKIDVSEVLTNDTANGFEITADFINANIQLQSIENIINITECAYNNEFENILYNSNESLSLQETQRVLSNIMKNAGHEVRGIREFACALSTAKGLSGLSGDGLPSKENTDTINIICVNYATKEGVNYVKLLSEHGERINDIISIIDENSTLCENNIYYKLYLPYF